MSRYKFLSRYPLFFVLVFVITIEGKAQNLYSLKATLVDSIDGNPIQFATCTFYLADSTIAKYNLSNKEGKIDAAIRTTKPIDYILITCSEYRPFRFKIKNENTDLGIIKLYKSFQDLDSILIHSEIPPIVVKKDTIEYSVDAFKMLPDALLKDILKKLPGTTFEDGNLFFNGKRIYKILVEGKEFFGNNIEIALENLPNNIINKIQVYDEKNFDDVVVSKVINLKLKKRIKQGWFGKTYGGLGINANYELGGIASLFRDTLQLSLLGYGNNINKIGFGIGDIKDIGGFSRNKNAAFKVQENTYSLNGISFGGALEGVQISRGAGINLNHILFKKAAVNLSYFNGYIDNENIVNVEETQNIDINTIQTINKKIRNQIQQFDQINFTVSSGIGRKSNINFGVSLLSTRKNISYSSLQNLLIDNQLKSINNNSSSGSDKQTFKNLNFEFKKVLKNKSSLFILAQVSDNPAIINVDNNIQIRTGFDSNINLYHDNRTLQSTYYNIKLQYKHVASKKMYFLNQAEYEATSNRFDFLRSVKTSGGELVDSNRSFFVKRYLNHFVLSSTVYLTIKKSVIFSGLALNYNKLFYRNQSNNIQNFFLAPKIGVQKDNFTVTLSRSITFPEALYSLSFQETLNPIVYWQGNIKLAPTENNTLFVDYQKLNFEKGTSFFMSIIGGIASKPIIITKVLDTLGNLMLRPENGKASKSFGATSSFSWSFNGKRSATKLSLSLNPNIVFGNLFFNYNGSNYNNFSASPSLRISSSVGKFEYSLLTKFFYSKSLFSNPFFNDFSFHYIKVLPELIYRTKNQFILESSLDYSIYPDLSDQDNNIAICNFAVSKMLLKNNTLQLKISIFDILNENKSIINQSKENTFISGDQLALKRFGMFSIIYNIRNIRTQKVGGKNSLLSY